MLRNRSVGAWRNMWFWLVRELAEPHTAAALATSSLLSSQPTGPSAT